VAVSLIYVPQIFAQGEIKINIWPVSFQILLFIVVSVMLGLLFERAKRRNEKMLVIENLAVLGRAAIAVGHEMKDLLNALKRMAHHAKGLNSTELDRDFEKEMSRLEQMVEILSSFVTTDPVQLFSHDMNEVIRKIVEKYQKAAGKIGVTFEKNLDEKGCPSQVNSKTIGWILEQIIINALEVSSKGKIIHIRSRRSGSNCTVKVEDEGPGIKPEHFPNMFKPFFTTKKLGQGLALSASRKMLRDMGGEILVASGRGKGAEFTLTIPREYSGKPLAADPVATIIRGEKVESIYRE